ncbi:S8 family serine peptidase [Actinoplanes regularis]|uniref:S8 family serine peptidase n=1 Tax=Actinoplanes regularis TaxID=52697 RepID=UPI00249FF8E7|nr:S8 family serine peptidase [Actinoplanes regularis]GLW29583.1 type VII secretion-associated serine protease [Actinoplanes regularis]
MPTFSQALLPKITLFLLTTLPLPASFHADHVRDSEWHLNFLNIKAAHAITTGNGIIIGLPDTGVDPHPDIIDNLIAGTDLTSSEKNQGQSDKDGHGTELAGLIVGHGHSSTDGILGISPSAQLLPIKSYEVADLESRLAEGIELSATLGAKVINVSAGTSPSRGLQRAIATAARTDALVVAASGNDQSATGIGYPAALPGVLAVGAIDQSGKHAAFSISGPNVALCAPGDKIVTTGLNSTYRIAQGTSAAAAIVSGAAALVRAKFPELSAQEVIHRLTATATDIGPPGRDEQCGYGVINIVKALTEDVPAVDGSLGTATGSSSADASSADAGEPGGGSGMQKVGVLGGIAAVLAAGACMGFLAARRRSRKQEQR